MSFAIPAATSITSLFVTRKSFYTVKDTGEIRANVQALSPIPAGAYGNAEGFELTEYAADPSCLDQIDLSQGRPIVLTFESQIRPITDRYGRTTNTQTLIRVVPQPGEAAQPQSAAQPRPAAQAPQSPKAGEPAKA